MFSKIKEESAAQCHENNTVYFENKYLGNFTSSFVNACYCETYLYRD